MITSRRVTRLLLPTLLLLVLYVAGPARALQPEAAVSPLSVAGSIRILPATAQIDPGQSVTVEIWLENVGDFYGLDLRFSFDPAVVSVPTGKATPLWELFDATNHMVIKNEANNTTGQVWYAVTNLNPAAPFSGSGRVASITFQGVAPGGSPLTFSYVKGGDREGGSLYPTWSDGHIQVGPAPTASIAVLVWDDEDRNGGRAPSELGLAGVTVDLYEDVDDNSVLGPGDALLDTRTTIANGTATFGALPLAKYLVDVTDTGHTLTHYIRTTAAGPTAITLTNGGQVINVQFGYDWQRWIYLPVLLKSWDTPLP